MRYSFLALVLMLTMAGPARANNNLFLPGDAFFPTTFSIDEIKKLEAAPEGTYEFEYSSLGGYDGAFCGYAGYDRAKVPAIDKAFLVHLKKAFDKMHDYERRRYMEMEREGKQMLVETNPVRVLIYPGSFDFRKRVLGLRYNENWVAEAVKFGHRPEHLRLCCLLKSPRALELSWRDSTRVEALKVTLPDVELQPVPRTEASVVVEGEVKVVVFASISLDGLMNPEEFEVKFVVDAQGMTHFEYTEEDGWREVSETEGE